MNEIPQLMRVKQFFVEAEKFLDRKDDFGHGLAVSLAQDGAELLLRSVARHRQASVKDKAAFSDLVNALDTQAAENGLTKVPHRAHLEELNAARVGFKHHGTVPSVADAKKLVRYGLDFAETASQRFFEVDLSTLSMADLIRDDKIRELVKAAESHLSVGETPEALIEAADAVALVNGMLQQLMPLAPQFGDSSEQAALAGYLDGVRLLALAAAVKFDIRDVVRFRGLGVRVQHAVSGKRFISQHRHQHTEHDLAFAVRFAGEFALAVEAALS